MPEMSLAALRGLLPQMGGANFGVAGPQEQADMPLSGLDRAVQYALPFSAQPQAPRDETVAYRTASPYVNITTQDIANATDKAMAFSGGGLATRDPNLWSPISNIRLRKPLAEMEHTYTDVRTPELKTVDPASMVGGHLILTPWDLSAANKTLTHVDSTQLPNPVRLHGGVGFPEANPGLAAASEQGFAKPLDNLANEYAQKGPVYIAPMTMSPMGIDASHHVAAPLAQLVQQAPIKRADAQAFNDMMREQVPGWVPTTAKNFQDYIGNLQGGMTTKALMANRMALAEWQAKGFPDVAAVRHATSEPGLIDVPRNTVGMAISRYEPGRGLLDTTHPSYSKGVAGDYMGQFASLVPYEVAAPSLASGIAEANARNFAAGKKVAIQPAYHAQKPIGGVPKAQYLDQEWLDNIMGRIEKD